MTALTKEDRIQISAKLVGIKDEKAQSDVTIAAVNDAKVKAQAKDDSNKKLVDSRTVFINSYQKELKYLDGNVRTELIEQIMLDSAKKVKNNSFFPIDPQTPLPSLPTGVWVNFIPYSKTHAIGKTNLETYSYVCSINPETNTTQALCTTAGGVWGSTYTRKEPTIIADINAKITLIEAQFVSHRATGKKCTASGCSINPGVNTTQALCTAAGGVWTSGPNDVYSDDSTVKGYLTDLKTLVQEWEDTLNAEKIQIPTNDTNSTRSLGNTNSISDINNSINIINNWQDVQDYDTATALPTGSNGTAVAAFDGKSESYFQQAKLQPTALQALKNELTARAAYVALRVGELTGSNYLGSITQNLSTGSLTSTQGLYGERIYFIDMRINILGGSLSELISLEGAISAQEQIKEAANNAATGLGLIMKATKAAAPGIDTQYLNLESLSGFSPNDRIYVTADDQEELSGVILEITGNRAKLSFNIPKKYTTSNNTRLYKVL